MTIHDELILELIKPDKSGKPTGDIIKIVGKSDIKYYVEQMQNWFEVDQRKHTASGMYEDISKQVTIIPDIVVRIANKETAIELENDIQWDFASSLRQVTKYLTVIKDVVVIIPKEYERFATLYKNEGFRVWLWKATRIWACMRCGSIKEEERTVQPRCSECKSTEQRLKGLKDVKFEEFS